MNVLLAVLVGLSVVLALISNRLIRTNLRAYRPLPAAGRIDQVLPGVSVLIPARNEEKAIGAAVSSALARQGVELEVVVLDDHSEDATARIVQELAEADGRVRLIGGPELPPGWCGKQHACWALSRAARYPVLVFMDADVRLEPDALARVARYMDDSGADLISGFPRQVTVGLLEKLMIPLMHFILLGFLPIERMRHSRDPAYAAGCGQLFVTRRESYERAGGHAAIRSSLHDGLTLPRTYRQAGLSTDLFDATDLAVCRMYRGAAAVWNGLIKNAGEALAAPRVIVPMSTVLLIGQVAPLLVLVLGVAWLPETRGIWTAACGLVASAAVYQGRWALAVRFRQSRASVLAHPLGILVLVASQWYAWAGNLSGRPSTWKGRQYRPSSLAEPPSSSESSSGPSGWESPSS